ncbi:MAG: NAD-dependent epimerase/dehydratase family protein [Chitinophagales bacterium]|nr:NAD-dependent epimerase/dehydratase family protein [Chitinophagales bacterium]
MKIAVTGASGHVGPNLCKALIAKGHDVKAMYIDRESSLDNINVERSEGDILNFNYVKSALKGTEAVFHLACLIGIDGDPDGQIHRVNVEGTRNVVMAALDNGLKKMIHFSTIHSYNEIPSFEELNETRDKVGPDANPYDYSKKLSEDEVYKGIEKGLDAIIVCPTSIMGPEDHEPSLLGQAMIDMYNQKVPALIPGGYDWVDVRDIVDGTVKAFEKGRSGETYLMGGKFHSMKDLALMMEKATGKLPPKYMTPFWLAKLGLPFMWLQSKFTGKEPPYSGEVIKIFKKANRCVSYAKAERELGYSSRPVQDTVTDMYNWFKEHNYIS